jgi:hypothetical protein
MKFKTAHPFFQGILDKIGGENEKMLGREALH